MNKAVKSLLLGSLSLSLLAGCDSDDKKDSPEPPNPPVVQPEEVVLYGSGATGEFQMKLLNSDRHDADLPEDRDLDFGNISTKPAGKSVGYGVNVVVSQDEFGSVRLTSANGHEIDLSEPATKGTLQFDMQVNSKPLNDAKASIMMVGYAERPLIEISSIDITSAIYAYKGGTTQTVRIPLHCFADNGFDFSQTLTPFALNTEGDLDIDIDNIRFVPNSDNNRYNLPCDSNSDLIKGDSTTTVMVKSGNPANGFTYTGWGSESRTWGRPDILKKEDKYNAAVTAIVKNSEPGGRGGLIFDVVSGELNKDLSQFVENGVLRFQLRVDDYALHPTRQMRVSFETPGNNSFVVNLDEGCSQGEWGRVEVPIKELITRNDGTIDPVIIQNVRNPLNIAPADVSGRDTIIGMEYSISNIYIDPEPTGLVNEGYCQRKS